MSDAPTVTVDHEGAVAVIRYTNAPSGLISNKGAALLADRIGHELEREATRCVVLTGGDEGVFIRHADVSQIRRAGDAVASGAIRPEDFAASPFARIGHMLDASEKPVIAAIKGVCMGGGLEIALACTLRIAASSPNYSIGLPEIRLGIFPGAGGIARLARLIGAHRARRFALEGAIVNARAAAELGLIDELAADPVGRAIDLATIFAGRHPAAVAAIMELAAAEDDDSAIERSMIRFGELVGGSREIRHRLSAFAKGSRPLEDMD
ncbi:enoyl-CoA hydratase/isomerase family protein [Sphingopyxis sp.]|uniref:enoyl-CoA hydratase/isomerase family protein n=1 Tax=Sphingopyxis sp. TaxID=1908224 RepID=UPI0025ED7589|nr:enoyl-CoA hydratase/isomerase family protein [Sphingopyxis sp.]MBR2171085.1 enoyl-CoA hydratase/isomerase family protein [Sphingopyxis sp.]